MEKQTKQMYCIYPDKRQNLNLQFAYNYVNWFNAPELLVVSTMCCILLSYEWF